MGFVSETRLRSMELSVPLEPDVVVTVHHDFGQGRIVQKWLKGTEAEDVVARWVAAGGVLPSA